MSSRLAEEGEEDVLLHYSVTRTSSSASDRRGKSRLVLLHLSLIRLAALASTLSDRASDDPVSSTALLYAPSSSLHPPAASPRRATTPNVGGVMRSRGALGGRGRTRVHLRSARGLLDSLLIHPLACRSSFERFRLRGQGGRSGRRWGDGRACVLPLLTLPSLLICLSGSFPFRPTPRRAHRSHRLRRSPHLRKGRRAVFRTRQAHLCHRGAHRRL
jgi:hypothetical protein